MTIELKKPNILDRILALFGKEREIIMPKDIKKYGSNVYAKAIRESFWKSLFSTKKK